MQPAKEKDELQVQYQDITLLLNIQELKITNVEYPTEDTVVINAIPNNKH